jgi:hypothetical protein
MVKQPSRQATMDRICPLCTYTKLFWVTIARNILQKHILRVGNGSIHQGSTTTPARQLIKRIFLNITGWRAARLPCAKVASDKLGFYNDFRLTFPYIFGISVKVHVSYFLVFEIEYDKPTCGGSLFESREGSKFHMHPTSKFGCSPSETELRYKSFFDFRTKRRMGKLVEMTAERLDCCIVLPPFCCQNSLPWLLHISWLRLAPSFSPYVYSPTFLSIETVIFSRSRGFFLWQVG